MHVHVYMHTCLYVWKQAHVDDMNCIDEQKPVGSDRCQPANQPTDLYQFCLVTFNISV